MAESLVMPWHTKWWPEIVRTAEKGGHSAIEVVDKVSAGHAIGWPVDGGYLVLCRSDDDRIVVWIGVGVGVRQWCGQAEKDVSAFARSVGCIALRIEGRKGWRRILPHWKQVGDDLELPVT